MRSTALLSLLALAGASFAAPLEERTSSPPTAKVRNGTLEGRHVPKYGQDFFLGIPYAQAPVDELRLNNPASLNKTFPGGKQNAKQYFPSCVGYGSDQWGYPISEDCLALNVIRPENTTSKDKLPVALWIHGGGYTEGGSRDKRYNLSFMVQNSVEMGKPIIATSINYRLAQWGFLAGDEVQKAGVANLGLKDQRLALHWIQENIAAFGGDPSKVTIWGESAGGGSVGYQAILYGGRDDHLFRGIIAESYYGNNFEANSSAYTDFYNVVLKAAGCTSGSGSLDCLRKVPYDKLNNAFNSTLGQSPTVGPVLDGDLLTELTSQAMNAGKITKTPILLGCNTDEGTAFGEMGINTTAQFGAAVASTGPDSKAVTELEKLYPDNPAVGIPTTYKGRPPKGFFLGQQWKRSAAFFGDYVMHGPRRFFNQVWTKQGVKSYSYRFNVRPNGLPDYIGVTHFQEVVFVFDNIEHSYGYGEPISPKPGKGLGPKYKEMAKLMDRMWISFIHDQDPNNHGIAGTPHWPAYGDDQTGQNFVFDVNVTSHTEKDTYRKDGIAYIIDNAVSQFHR